MLTLSPLVRLASGLTLLTVSLLLLLDFFGVMPNENKIKIDSRKVVAELLAVQVSNEIERGQFELVAETLQSLQKRSNDVLSAAIRLNSGRILASAGEHTQNWKPDGGRRSSVSQIEVPIYEEGHHWGSLELSFDAPRPTIKDFLQSGSINVVMLLVGICGFFIYWLFLKRALRELDPRSVIPERVNSALNVLAEGLVMLDLNGRMVLVNRAFEKKLGQSQESLIGKKLSDIPWEALGADGGESAVALPWARVLEREALPDPIQLGLKTKLNNNLMFAVSTAPITAGDGSIRGVVVTFDDVTELQQQNISLVRANDQLKVSKLEVERKNNELELLATRDPLTGVLNRRSLFEGMKTLAMEAQESQEPLSCIMVDIDRFKSINDRFGHGVGDNVIKLMADILTMAVVPSALVARYGGEEYVVVLPGATEEEAAQIAETMRTMVQSSELIVDGEAVRISASFGVSCHQTGNCEISELVDHADQALYKAKDTGRNRVCLFSALEDQDLPIENDANATEIDSAVHVEPSVVTADITEIDGSKMAEHLEGSVVTSVPAVGAGEQDLPIIDSTSISSDSSIIIIDRLTQSIDRSKRYGQHLAVLYVHIDALEIVNNTYGSSEADKVISTIKARLKQVLRDSDTVATAGQVSKNISVSRVGIAELIVLVTDLSNEDDITWIVKRLSTATQTPIEIGSNDFSVDTRMGISLFPGDAHSPRSLLANSRSALRDAKQQQTRNCSLFFDAEMNVRSEKQLLLESHLQQAIKRDELFLVYQPYVNLTTGKLAGFETLVRWRNPHFGFVSPVEFIPIAERTQLIDPIGRWIFDSAMRQLREWRTRGDEFFTLAVNFSAVQLRHPDFLNYVQTTVAKYDLPPSAVTIEITESMIIEDRESAASIILKLQAAGFRVALDDFGTGYSSLLYLKDMPIDVVKIDRSFFSDFPVNERDASIVAAIISLSASLNLTVVAEGVETDEQLEAILQMRCDIVQGYVFSAPLSRDLATSLITDSVESRRMLRPLSKIMRERASIAHAASDSLINEISDTDLRSLSELKVVNTK